MFKNLLSLSLLFMMLAKAENTYRLEVYGSSTHQEWNEKSVFNPNNSILKAPKWTHTLEFRPDIQLEFFEKHSMVLRSRHFLQSLETHYTNPEKINYSSDDESDLSDLFFASNWNDALSTTIGLQNYQWGPAEIFSPSNPFFHFDNNQRSFFYKEKGRVLVRANWNPNPDTTHWSVVGLYEPINNNTRFWTADKEFKPRSALKIEYQFDNPANAVAFVGGQGEDQRGFIGEYFSWSPVEGTSLYADMQHHQGRINYFPERNVGGLYDLLQEDPDRAFTLAVVGFRWEGRVDFRQEFIWNEAGYNSTEWKRASTSAVTLSPRLLQNSRRFAAPGMEFRTQSYTYTSLRIPDLGKSKKASVSARYLSSLTLNSSVLQFNYEYNWNDSTVISFEALQFLGSASGEFRLVANSQASIGFRWSY